MDKLKMNDKVLYWDGASSMDLTEVVLVDKEHSQVKLANGILLHRSPGEDGVFHRADYKEALEDQEKRRRKKKAHVPLTSISSAWKYGSGKTEQIWKAYCFKKSFANTYDKLRNKVLFTELSEIVNNPETLEFMEKVERKISKLV